MTTHVPAWKRLGLKLKYAKDIPLKTEEAVPSTNHADHNVKNAAERPTKRQRLTKDNTTTENGLVEHDRLSPNVPSTVSAVTKSDHGGSRRKKSVAFTNDTKVEDGDTRTTIDFPNGSLGNTSILKNGSIHDTKLNSSSSESQDQTPSVNGRTKPKQKKSSGKKGTSKSSQKDSGDKKTLALDYLNQHRNNRADWKFNKNRDVWIMSHALKKDSVPDSHVYALAGYVQGLPSASGARARLIEQCQAEQAKDDNDADDAVEDEERFLRGVQASEQDGLLGSAVEKYSRAEVLLWALGIKAKTTKPQRDISSAQPAAKKKRKSRTDVSDISSSSSDDDSSSESESENDLADRNSSKSKVVNTIKAGQDGAESTSSPEDTSDDETTSSSSSDSE